MTLKNGYDTMTKLSEKDSDKRTLKTEQKGKKWKFSYKAKTTALNLKNLASVQLNTSKVNEFEELEIELESLILAQDERWRHA